MSWKGTDKNEVFDTHYDRISEIRFKKRHTKSSIRLGAKLMVYMIIAGVSGAFFSNAFMKIKYDKIIQELREHNTNGGTNSLNYSNIIKNVSPSLVTISDESEKLLKNKYFDNNITGVIIDSKGNIVTSYSVIKNFKNIFVKLPLEDKEILKGEVIIKNEYMDFAIINIKYLGELKPIKFASTYNIEVGEDIVILGNPVGDSYIGNISPGVVTSVHERLVSGNKEFELLQVSAPIGNSNTAGAICNDKGELVGIASLELTQKSINRGFYYGVKAEEVRRTIASTNVLKNILGIVEGGILGGLEGYRGFYVEELDKYGSAYKAGIKPTDIILEIDSYEVMTLEDVKSILQNREVGDIIRCKILTGGEVKDIEIQISN